MTRINSFSGTLGTIEWEITEAPDWRVIHRGSRTIRREDIEITRVADEAWPRNRPRPRSVSAFLFVWERVFGTRNLYGKRIHLEGGFYLDLTERPVEERQRLRGFGFSAGHEATPTFSWEWFTVEGNGEYANKLRESGRLRIGAERGRSGWEIGYTEFLTDVSLRIAPGESARWDPEPPRWRIRIAKGSHVSWPSADERAEPAPSTLRPAVDAARPDPSGAPGTVEWEVTEAPEWRTVHRGSRTVERGDVKVARLADEQRARMIRKPRLHYALLFVLVWVLGRNRYRKRVHLEGGFYLDLTEKAVKERERYLGFSLRARHEATPAGSSKPLHHVLDYGGLATNQEGGRLRVGVRRGRSGWEVAYTEFLTDVSLRVAAKDEGDRSGVRWTEREPRWRVRITEGSRVYWPSVDERDGPAPPE